MKIIDTIVPDRPFISFEFFPPKDKAEWPAFFATVDRLAALQPLFASVTYGAGGSTHNDTLEIVTRIKREHGLETMAHLTCIGACEDEVRRFLSDLSEAGVSNVLALRGDPPKDRPCAPAEQCSLRYAGDLVSFIRGTAPEIGVGVAGYPEIHPEAASPDADLVSLVDKVGRGADFIVTQLFFDNRLYFDFVRRVRAAGCHVPVIPGILPVVNLKVIQRILSLCGAAIPPEFMAELEEADRQGGAAAVQKVGVAHARRQARELLAAGAPGVHLYTLNRSDAVSEIVDGLLSR